MSTLDFITGRSDRLCGFTSVIFIHVKPQSNHSGGGREVRAGLSKLKVNRAYKAASAKGQRGEWKKRLVRADNCVT